MIKEHKKEWIKPDLTVISSIASNETVLRVTGGGWGSNDSVTQGGWESDNQNPSD